MALSLKEELDLLLGADRNGDPSKRVRFDDRDMCKNFLLGFCLNDLFRNTKEDLGPCQSKHSPQAKAEWDKLSPSEQRRYGYEFSLLRELERWDQKARRTVEYQTQRLDLYKQPDQEDAQEEDGRRDRTEGADSDMDQEDGGGSSTTAEAQNGTETAVDPAETSTTAAPAPASDLPTREDIEILNQQIAELQTQAGSLGESGDVDASMEILRVVEELEEKKRLALRAIQQQQQAGADKPAAGDEAQADTGRPGREGEDKNSISATPAPAADEMDGLSEKAVKEIQRLRAQSQSQQQKLRVCQTCGALLSIFDSRERLADHFNGRLHLGFEKIREKLEELRKELGSRNRSRSSGGGGGGGGGSERSGSGRRRDDHRRSRSRSRRRDGRRSRRRDDRSRSRERRRRRRSSSRGRRRSSSSRRDRRSRSRSRRRRDHRSRSRSPRRR